MFAKAKFPPTKYFIFKKNNKCQKKRRRKRKKKIYTYKTLAKHTTKTFYLNHPTTKGSVPFISITLRIGSIVTGSAYSSKDVSRRDPNLYKKCLATSVSWKGNV